MKKQIISIFICVVLVLSTFSGCNNFLSAGSNEKPTSHLAIALNPILLFDETDTVIAFNDIKDSIVKDMSNNTITTLSKDTNWTWAYHNENSWKKRNVYDLEKWRNGNVVSTSKFSAYTFTSQGAISVMPFAPASTEVKTYQREELPSAAIAVAVSGDKKEALCYTFKSDATMHIPENTVTAIQSLDGVTSNFLELGTNRTAVVSYTLNERIIWAGEFSSNSDNYVTQLTCPDKLNISVTSGDVLFISVQLNTTLKNIGYTPEEDEIDDEVVDIPNDSDDSTDSTDESLINLMTGFDSTFKIVFGNDATTSQKDIINQLRVDMVNVFDADVLISDDKANQVQYELLVGKTNRKESVQAYADLNNGRKNNGSDFIIRVSNNKLVIAANTDYALKLATRYFMSNYCKTDRDSVKNNLNFKYTPKLGTITIDNQDISKYIIRTEKYPSLLTLRAAELLSEYIVSKTGYNLDIVCTDKNSEYEILVGLTTASGISANVFKSESLDNLGGYELNEFNIFVKNKKLFIESGSTYATNFGVTQLVKALDTNKNIKSNFSLKGSYTDSDYSLTGGYAYTWGDEFLSNSTSLSRKRWNVETGSKVGPWYAIDDPYYLASKLSLSDEDPSNDFGGPWSDKIYDDARDEWVVQEGVVVKVSDYSLENNVLVMNTRRTTEGYSGVSIQTKGLMEFRYGILEARVIMATNNGATSTFWTRSRDGGTLINEFDLCENFGEDKISPNMHTWADGGATHVDHKKQLSYFKEMYPANGEHFYDTYHYLTMEWTPEKVDFYLDGVLYLSQDITTENWKAFSENTYLLFDCTAPGNNYSLWSGAHNPGNFLMENIDSFHEKMYIDNVRIYQISSRQYALRAKK